MNELSWFAKGLVGRIAIDRSEVDWLWSWWLCLFLSLLLFRTAQSAWFSLLIDHILADWYTHLTFSFRFERIERMELSLSLSSRGGREQQGVEVRAWFFSWLLSWSQIELISLNPLLNWAWGLKVKLDENVVASGREKIPFWRWEIYLEYSSRYIPSSLPKWLKKVYTLRFEVISKGKETSPK